VVRVAPVQFLHALSLEGNLVRLTPAQWNDLVRKVRGGGLEELTLPPDPAVSA